MVGKGRVLLLVFLLVSLQASSDSYYIRVRLSIYKVGKSPKKVSFSFKEKKLKSERNELSAAGLAPAAAGLAPAAEGGVSANNVYKNATFLGDFQTSCFVRISKNKFFSP